MSATVGLRELRQDASELVRRVEAGEEIDITTAAAVVAAGRQPRARTTDLLIAATAHAHGARLYTRNAADLLGLGDLIEIATV